MRSYTLFLWAAISGDGTLEIQISKAGNAGDPASGKK
jgi:hypothetical protein